MPRWSWIGACSTGSSHIRAGTACQDSASCIELVVRDQHVLLALVSDGAGSAEYSAIGSRLVVECFARCVIAHLRANHPFETITKELVLEWLDDVRDHIFRSAEQRSIGPRDMAATLVGAIVSSNRAIVCHVGDGACVLRKKGGIDWQVASWPSHGEYASSTYFITDDPQPTLQFHLLDGEFNEVAIFSDGIERLALDFVNGNAFAPFFEPMFAPLVALVPGRDRRLSLALRKYLDSSRVIERTDDDKSLILARRVI
jgi:protein phosphatase 2C-like protein